MKIFLLLTALLFASCSAAPPDDSSTKRTKTAEERIDKAATIVVDKIDKVLEEDAPIPRTTMYKVSDVVCAWEKYTGVVIGIRWSQNTPEGHERVLVYEIKYDVTVDNEEPTGEFYETELERGKCN